MRNSVLIIAALFLLSCDSNKFFEEYQSIPERNWKQFDIVEFEVTSTDTIARYNCFIELRNTESYKYRNLFVFLDIVSPSGQQQRDTLECLLADINGKWYGNTAGNLIDNKVWFKTDYQFTELGKYSFQFQQAMREDPLQEISDFGLRIETK